MTDRARFDFDLRYGESRERRLQEVLGRVEVKSDRRAVATGNMILEISQELRNGNREPSGIEVTHAEFFAYEWAVDCWLIVPAPLVRRAVRDWIWKGTYKLRSFGDNGNQGLIIPIQEFVARLRLYAAGIMRGES